jgi:ABC-type multidrug transport system ATPase subunit
MLKKLTVLKKTIIFTIHQPSSDIYNLFDRIMLLVDGRFIYQGPKNEVSCLIGH